MKSSQTCESPRCQQPKARQNGYLLRYCWRCKSRLLKLNHPATYFLNSLRHSARKRGLSFTLTVEQFREFCDRTGFLALKGKKENDATIDRIDWNRGYEADNIQMLSHGLNSRQGKYNLPRYIRKQIESMENCK